MPEPAKPADAPASETPPPTNPPANTPPANEGKPAEGGFDPKILESEDLWKHPRMKELLDANKELKDLKTSMSQAEEDKLKEDNKFKELADKKAAEVTQLTEQLKTVRTDNALTIALSKVQVVDLDAALKLIDRSKLTIGDDGTISGIDDAVAVLKTDKAYLFNPAGGENPTLGNPANGGTPPNGAPAKFKRSQLQDPAFYKAHEKEILEAYSKGEIEDDINK